MCVLVYGLGSCLYLCVHESQLCLRFYLEVFNLLFMISFSLCAVGVCVYVSVSVCVYMFVCNLRVGILMITCSLRYTFIVMKLFQLYGPNYLSLCTRNWTVFLFSCDAFCAFF